MIITYESELMKNHKHAVVMAPDSKFEAVQTIEGHSLLFSIGTDGVFYLTRETPLEVTGWTKTDLSSSLAAEKVNAKTFAVSQNNSTGNIDMALGVNIGGKDFLYTSVNNSNTDTSWTSKIPWQVQRFDDPKHTISNLVIADLYIAQAHSGEVLVADILKDPANPLGFVARYYIDPSKTATGSAWNEHDLSGDMKQGTLQSCIGKKAQQSIDGIYTLGEISGKTELIYTPLYERFGDTAPVPSVLTLPSLASAIALAPNQDKATTNLFVAGDKALYFYPSDKQGEGSTGQQIVSNPIFSGVQALFADASDTEVFVWGLNQAGAIFYLKCPAGQETNTASWSAPVPLLQGVEQITPYVNLQTGHSVIFAHADGQNLVQLSQDPATAIWQQRNILLPATDMKDVLEYNSFTTHVQVAGDSNLPSGKSVTLSITSQSPVGIYVNNVYHKLSSTVATLIDTDARGALTIVQETQALTATCYHVVHDASGVSVDINPMDKALKRMSDVQSSDDLDKIQVNDANGAKKPLIPPDISKDQKDATTDAIKQFVTVAGTLPPDGSKKNGSAKFSRLAVSATNFVVKPDTIWGMTFSPSGSTYHEGTAAMARFGLQVKSTGNTMMLAAAADSPADFANAIESVAEDIFSWLKKAFEEVTEFFVHLVDDVYHFVIRIAGQFYRFIMDCVNAVVQAVEFVFNKIKVFFEDLIQWLGFLFNWSDIVRTHKVMKNIIKQYASHCVANVEGYKAQLQAAFSDLEKNINGWAGLPDLNQSVDALFAPASKVPGQNSPQSQWGIYHTQHNVTNANSPYEPDGAGDGSSIQHIFEDLLGMIQQEGTILKNAINTVKTEIIDKLPSLTLTDILKKIVAILADVLLETVENLTLKAIDIVAELVKGILGALDAPIEIPVISWLYEKISGGEALSILDLVCLVFSIPATIIYKLVYNEAPFADDSVTRSFSTAPDFATLQQLYASNTRVSKPVTRPNVNAAMLSVSADPISQDVTDKLVFSGNVMAFGGSILLSIVNPLKLKFPTSGILSFLSGVLYLPYVAPNIMGSLNDLTEKKWYVVMNQIVSDICTLKALADMSSYKSKTPGTAASWSAASPWVEYVMNIIWQVPTTAALFDPKNQTMNGMMGFAGGSLFDIGGILAPAISEDEEPVTLAVFVAASIICNLGYGSLCLAQSLDTDHPL